LVWLPTSDLHVRVSYGTSFRPPSLFELYSPQIAFGDTPVIDPRRNNEPAFVTAITGGNPELDPIEAKSLTAGITWSPSLLEGLQLSATYWRVSLDDRVQFFSEQLVLLNEALFPERVVRAAPTPADVAAGLPGVVETVDTSRLNFGTLETDGVDLDVRWSFSTAWGDWLPSLSATWVDRYEAGQAPGTPALDRVDLASQEGTILRWRAIAGLSWQRQAWGAALTARYAPTYDDANAIGVRTGRRVEDQLLVDAQVSLDFRRMDNAPAWLQGLSMQAGVVNLFDEAPPFAEIGAPLGYDLSQGDLRQRFGYVNLSKRF
jgi:iron complex outermembrane recepter protein